MRIKAQLHWMLLIVTMACSPNPAASASIPAENTATLPIIAPTVTASATATSVPTLTPTAIVITPPALHEIKWATYEFSIGASFEYPSDWFIVSQRENSVEFMFSYSPYNLSAHVFDLPVNDPAMTDPHSWGPNEGGFELLWEKSISIQDADGLEYIYAMPSDNPISGWLTALYYSEKHGLVLRLDSFADTIPTETDKYNIFEHMVKSVRIGP